MKLYFAVWKASDGVYCPSIRLYKNEEEAKVDLGESFVQLWEDGPCFNYTPKVVRPQPKAVNKGPITDAVPMSEETKKEIMKRLQGDLI